MKRMFIMFSLISFVLFYTGCATYKSQMVRMEPMEAYKNRVTNSNITIAIDPYDTSSKAKQVFYVDVTKKNIKPIQVIVDNKSSDNIMILRSQIRLTDSSGNEYLPVNSKYVYDLF